jgi:V/A-type H+-transporting ATPase subunit F
MKTLVIADEDTVIGFSLAGVQGVIVTTVEETRNAFDQATQMNDVGILLLAERVAQMIREKVDNWIIGGGQPLIIEIPDSQGPLEGRRTPHEFVKSAIGVKF